MAPIDDQSTRRRSLVRRLFVANATLVVAAFSVLALTPLAIKSPLTLGAGGLLSLLGLTVLLATNLAMIRRSLTPLKRLTNTMASVDLLRPGRRVPVYGDSEEVVQLTHAFNAMLSRLEQERRDSVRRTLTAQENERLQLARELHDEIGQGLTGLLLQLDYLGKTSPEQMAPDVREAREAARACLEEVRRIARQLRPEALDDLGLVSAVSHLADRIATRSGLEMNVRLERRLPPVPPDAELVIYRVAQESLTNVIRHAEATHIDLSLIPTESGVALRVADDGRGIDGAVEGAGVKGMRERAVLAGASLEIGSSDRGGTEVCLEVPVDAGARDRPN